MKMQQRFIVSFNWNISPMSVPSPPLTCSSRPPFPTSTYRDMNPRLSVSVQSAVTHFASHTVGCTLCSAPVLTQYFGSWRNLYDIFFLHILLTHYMSVLLSAKWRSS